VAENTLYYGDNLDVLQRYIKDETIDLIYLDPPFNSNTTYNVLFTEKDGSKSAAQIQAFEDTWHWDDIAEHTYLDVVEQGGKLSVTLQAFEKMLEKKNDMMAYLTMMAPRLVEMRRTLKPTGSIYLHCDPSSSHYLKILMDAVFGAENFLNEIVWYYRGAGVPKTARARRHDILFVYSKSLDKQYFNPDPIRRPYAEATVERFSHYIGNVRGGKDFGVQQLNPLGKHPDDVITDIQPIAPSARARLGYPTQKPEELLEEVILASSKEGDLVMDPFCGCGTTIAVAERLKRNWIGIDITHLAINLIKRRMRDIGGDDLEYEVIGEPTSFTGAEQLASQDPYQFQYWALGLVGARPVEKKKGADKGIDGQLFFHEEGDAATKQIIFSVKAGHTQANHVRDLHGVIDRENAEIGVLIIMQEPTQPMRTEAASCGIYKSHWGDHPRLQILTIQELLEGKKVDMPPVRQVNDTFKKAPRAKKQKPQTRELPGI